MLAQVKLSFKSTTGARMVATRNLQLTVKKTTRSQKTLEGQLLMIKDGERTAISSRVAELDQILPQYLGVSKAILESVIFCHQDDSLWPMSEPSVLKKKFDEIFEAQKYTKAIENIKILRKKQNEELAKFKIIEQHAKEDKDKGERAEKRMTELYDEIDGLRNQVEEVQGKVQEAKEKSREAFDRAARYEQIVARLNGKRIELKAFRENVVELEQSLKEMTDSDEELQSILDRYQERVAQYDQEREKMRRKYSDMSHGLDISRRSLGLKQNDVGKFEAQKEQFERQLRQREALIRETAQRHSIRGFDFEITETHVTDFMDIIGKLARDQNRLLDRAHHESQEELQEAQNALDQLTERRSALNQSKESCRSQITVNDKRVASLQADMDRIEVDEGGEAVLKDQQDNTERRLKKAVADAEAAKLDDQIRNAETRLRDLEDSKDDLDVELVEATKSAHESARIGYLHNEVKKAQNSLDTMQSAHRPKITEVVGPNWDASTLEADYQRVSSQKAFELKDAEAQRDSTLNKLDQINFRISTAETEQKKKRREAEKCEGTVQNALDGGDVTEFEQIFRQREEEYELVTSDQTKFQATMDYFKQCLQTAQQHSQCRLCQRPLNDDGSGFTKTGFMKRLRDTLDTAAQKAEQMQVDELSADLDRLKSAKASYDLLTRLQKAEVPALKAETGRLSSERETLNRELEQHDGIIYERRGAKQEADSLARNVQSLVQYYNDVRRHEREIQDLSAKQEAMGGSRAIEAIQDDLKKLSDETKGLKATTARLVAERDRSRALINSLELKIRDINAKLSVAQTKLREKNALVERIEEYKSSNSEQRESMQRIDQDIQRLIPQVEQANVKREDVRRRGNERVQNLQNDAQKLSDSVRQLKYGDQEIHAFVDRGGVGQFERTQKEITELEDEAAGIEGDMRQVTVQIKAIEDNLRNTDDTKRSINDNIRYRRAKRNLETCQREIEELEEHNAESDKSRSEREGSKWQTEWNRLSTQEASLFGTLKSKDDQLKGLIDEYNTEYQNAATSYREAHIRVEATKAAVEDLGRYGGALDKAIMKYHSLKMGEINTVIRELWQSTYQGADVDTIVIRSDNETAKGNQSYNYRVVMIKQDAEMDMRGRCSAGQKVLASIIIRLALAECFGVNCGLIALDEPTTNLDASNIEALANALADIIKVRRKQANFQIIVITHDEEFLKHMQCADFCDTYYRVSRNAKQKSVIERQSIHEVR